VSALHTNQRASGSVLDAAALDQTSWIQTCWPSSRSDLTDHPQWSVMPIKQDTSVCMWLLMYIWCIMAFLSYNIVDGTVATCKCPFLTYTSFTVTVDFIVKFNTVVTQATERWNAGWLIELVLFEYCVVLDIFYPAKLQYLIQFLIVLSFSFSVGQSS